MKNKYLIPFITLLSLTFISCGQADTGGSTPYVPVTPEPEPEPIEPVPEESVVTVNDFIVPTTIHNEAQLALINSSDPDEVINNDTMTYSKRSLSKPNPLSISWDETNIEELHASEYLIKLSTSSDLSNPFTFKTSKRSFDIYNSMFNETYYFSVSALYKDKTFESDIHSFTISDSAPKNIYVDGVENCRDLGGWDIGNNRIYKYGMIYRTAQFNKPVSSSFKSSITADGIYSLKNVLGVKTDIDLRLTKDFTGDGSDETGEITSSPLGEDVKYVSTPMYYQSQNIFTRSENKESIKEFFNTLSDINNYPIAFHCVRGTDRTGALAYALGALVGMNKDDLMLDYLFSDVANISSPVRETTISGEDFFIQGIENSEGNSLSEKTKNYLITNIGVESSTLDTIIDILTDEVN